MYIIHILSLLINGRCYQPYMNATFPATCMSVDRTLIAIHTKVWSCSRPFQGLQTVSALSLQFKFLTSILWDWVQQREVKSNPFSLKKRQSWMVAIWKAIRSRTKFLSYQSPSLVDAGLTGSQIMRKGMRLSWLALWRWSVCATLNGPWHEREFTDDLSKFARNSVSHS